MRIHLDNRELGSSNVKRINISGQSSESLLGAIGSDKSVDLDGIDIVQLLQCLLDLSLVGLDVNDEYQGVVLLDLLHCALGVERVDDDLVGIESGLMRNRLSWVLGASAELEGLGSVEGGAQSDLASFLRLYALEGGFGCGAGLC